MTPFCNLPPELKRHISSFLFENDDDEGTARFHALTDDATQTKLVQIYLPRFRYSKTQKRIDHWAGYLTQEALLDITDGLRWEKNNFLELYKTNLFLDYIDCFHSAKLNYLESLSYLNQQICEKTKLYLENEEHFAVVDIMENAKTYTRGEMAKKCERLYNIRDHLEAKDYQKLLQEYFTRERFWYRKKQEPY